MIQIGEMVLPAFDCAARCASSIFGGNTIAAGPTLAGVIKPRKSSCDLRGCGKELLHFLPINSQIGKAFVRHAPCHPVQPANCIVLPQGPWIKFKLFDDLDQYPRRERTLIAFDEVKVGGRNAEHASHHGLGEAFSFAKAAERGTCKDSGVSHVAFVNMFTC